MEGSVANPRLRGAVEDGEGGGGTDDVGGGDTVEP
jgi:hypothetical protein